jgi:hypothetical protein
MSKKEDVVLEAVTEYAKNPDTYDANIEVLKAQPNISYQNRQLVDKIFILLTNSNFDISFNLNILAASSFIPSVKAL